MMTTHRILTAVSALSLAAPAALAGQRNRVVVDAPQVRVAVATALDVQARTRVEVAEARVEVAATVAMSRAMRTHRLVTLAPTVLIAPDLPPAWDAQDPADSLYRAGRQALNQNQYPSAIEVFETIRTRYPRSSYAPDAYYWEAWSRYRQGGTRNLQAAVQLLDDQARRFPNASTRRDAPALSARVLGALARDGDSDAAARIREEAQSVAVSPPTPPAAPAAPSQRSRNSRQSRECRENQDDLQAMAVNSLLQMPAEQAVPLLRRVLARRDSASVCLRRRAVFMVAQHDTRESGQILLDAIRNDPDSEVRSQAVFWLSQVEGEEAVTALQDILLRSNDPELQEKAIFALSQHDGRQALDALRRYAENTQNPANLRDRAIFWLGQSGDAQSIQWMQGLYGRTREPEIKKRILFAVSQADGSGGGRWLTEVAKNPNESIEMRKQAIFWAGQRDDSPIAELVSLYNTLPDRELKEQLLFVMSQRDSRESVDKLVEIVRTERDVELRRRALFWLSQTGDPRVAQLIAEILERP